MLANVRSAKTAQGELYFRKQLETYQDMIRALV